MEDRVEFSLKGSAAGPVEPSLGGGSLNASQPSQERTSSSTELSTVHTDPDPDPMEQGQDSSSLSNHARYPSFVNPWYVPPVDATVCPAELGNPWSVPANIPDTSSMARMAIGTVEGQHNDGVNSGDATEQSAGTPESNLAVNDTGTAKSNLVVNNNGETLAVDSNPDDDMEYDSDADSNDDYEADNDFRAEDYYDEEDDAEDDGGSCAYTSDTNSAQIDVDGLSSNKKKLSPQRQAQIDYYKRRMPSRYNDPLFMRSRVYTRSSLARELKLVPISAPTGVVMEMLAWQVQAGKGVQGDNAPFDSFHGKGKRHCENCEGVCRWKGMMPKVVGGEGG
ncbi:uncharacterized protein BP5553_00399 [Venustampulla echinocandica]|uniref:Uncharacterized protein n=1 Tax=Venustampulla echinocandica TaxID=2656787 RepID=A0A370TY28_9HELO|nr:uncharacterized protein BP5553_00399 [Venustampulla echinocandica]RDL40420.1 hypothetical protein BP5553_00399 [Venustampulla echinocandica]